MRTRFVQLATAAGALIAALLMGLFIAQLIGRPLAAARELLDSVALGDLSKRAEPSSKDEVGQMMKSLNSMIQNLQGTADTAIRISEGDLTVEAKLLSEKDLLGTALQKMPHNLRSTVREVSNAADNVASGSHEMSATAQQLSQGSSEQAASAEETTSPMEEMAASIQQNAETMRSKRIGLLQRPRWTPRPAATL